MFILWLSKPINVFFTGFIGGAGVIGFICRPWTSGCTDCCPWVTRTPRSCVCCWSRCDDHAMLWTGSKDLPHIFLHGSWRPRAVDSTNQGPTRGVDHRKSYLTANVILKPDAVPVSVTNAITGTCTTSWAWGWSFSCSCQHKGELCWSLRKRSKHGWLRQMRVVHQRTSSPLGCPRMSLWGIHNHSQHSFVAWSSEGRCWGCYRCRCSHSCTHWRG